MIKKAWNDLKNREYSFLAVAFFIPLMLLWLVHISFGVFPFGDNSVLVLDLNGQYVYYFEALRDIVLRGGSITYSWGRALGGEFMGIFAYYLSSPFSFLVLLFPKANITEAILTIILLKVGSMAATMAFYLHKTHPTTRLKTIIFSTMYALSAFVIVYGHNLMWLDALIWLPIITYGIEELIKKRRFKLFAISLAMGVMANFYIGFMLCIYVVVYFVYYYFAKSENGENNFWDERAHFPRSVLRLGFYSLIAVGAAAWIILPTYYSLTFGKTTFSDPNYAMEAKFKFFEFLSKSLYASYDTVRPEGLPQLYCGVLPLILTPLYFISPKVRRREKIAGAVITVFFVFSMCASTVDIFWHGLQRPNWLNYRYSFMLIFLMLVFSYKALDAIREINFKAVGVVCGLWALTIFCIQTQGFDFIYDLKNIWPTLGLLMIFAIALYAIKNGWLGRGSVLILAVIVCVEMFTAALLNTDALDQDVTISSRESYRTYIDRFESIFEEIRTRDGSFYRMEKDNHRKTNDPFALGYYGISNSTSTLNASQIVFLNQLGYSSKSHWSKYLGATPVSDSLIGMKYVVYETDSPRDFSELFTVDEDNRAYAYYNPYALSVAYAVDSSVDDIDLSIYDTPFEVMNALIGRMTGEGNVEIFKKLEIADTELVNLDRSYISGHTKYAPIRKEELAQVAFIFNNVPGERVYCFFPAKYPREVALMADGRSFGTFFGNESDRVVELDEFNGDTVRVSLTLNEENLYIANGSDFYFAYIDSDLYKETFTQLAKDQLNITEYSDTRLYGTVDVTEGNGTLFTTIPYDACWRVTVDGEEVPTFKVVDSMLAIHISPGEPVVEMRYVSDPMNYGITISVVSVAVFTAAVFCARARKKRRNERWQNEGV